MLDTPLDAVVGRDDEDVFGLTRSRPAGHTPSNPGWRSRLFVLAVMTFVAAAPGQAQETGTVRGTVTLAENGGPVDGAVILILGTGAFTFTENGAFEFTNVPVGSYLVTAQRERLTAGSQTVAVNAGETAAADFELGLAPVREEITVTAPAVGAAATLQTFNTVTTVNSFEIARQAPSTIGEALEHEPGIANRSFGPGASRPVIRGFGGDRVLIIEDGIRTGELSATSDHHGMTIDPNSAERIEIVRGPATLLYGSSVVGGLINIITPHAAYRNLLTPPQNYGDTLTDGTRAQLGTDAGSANGQAGTYANVQHSQGKMLYWGSGGRRRTGDYDTPEGPVFNSATDLASARTGLGYFGDRAFASGAFTFEDSRFGLPFDRFHAHGQDAHAEEDDHGDEEAGQAEDIRIDLASQRRVGRFDVGLRNLDNEFIQGVRAAFTAIDVADDHVDTIGGVDNIDTRFNNRTYITRAMVYQRQREHVSGRFGAEMQIRDFLATGTEALAPRTDQTTFAAFGYEELRFGRYSLQLGGRLERNDYMTAGRVGAPGHDEEDHHDEPEDDHDHGHDDDDDDHEGEEEEHPLEPPDPRDRQFLGASASVGLHADLGADSAFVASVMHAHRVPALQELYNYGPRLGNFEVGNPDLEAETTLGGRLQPAAPVRPGRKQLELLRLRHRELHLRGPHHRGGGQPAGPGHHSGRQPVHGLRRNGERAAGRRDLGHARHRLRQRDPDVDERGGAAHPAAARHHERRLPPRRAHGEPGADGLGAAGQGFPRRDRDGRLRRPEPGRVLHVAAAARGARPVVHRLQPRERAPSEPHVLHQGPRAGDGPRRQGELLVAVLLVSFSA